MSGNEPIATAALGDVLRERVRHMTDLGHDREHDDGLSIDYLPRLAAGRMIIATDRLAAGDRRDLAGARRPWSRRPPWRSPRSTGSTAP